jgi:hypothetical protein
MVAVHDLGSKTLGQRVEQELLLLDLLEHGQDSSRSNPTDQDPSGQSASPS